MNKTDNDKYWAKLIGQATVLLSGASEAELRVQLFDVLQEFFGDSNSWLEVVNFMMVPGSQDYPVIPLTGRIERLAGVIDQNNVPQAAVMPQIGVVHFLYPYTTVQPMWATVVKNVDDPFGCYPPHIPEWVLPKYGAGILSGLLGYMFLQPGQSYSNQALASFHLSRFRSKIAHARSATTRNNTIGAQSWAYPQQFAVRGQRGGVSTYNVYPVGVR